MKTEIQIISIKINPGQEMDVTPVECPICLGERAPDVALACGHMFCKSCIDAHTTSCEGGWGCPMTRRKIKATCPMCRGEDVTDHPTGDRLKAAIQDQVNGNLNIINKSIAFTRAGNAADWSPVSGETDWSKVTRIQVHC